MFIWIHFFQSLEEYAARCAELEKALEKPELTRLCDLAFPPPTPSSGKGQGPQQTPHQWVDEPKNSFPDGGETRRESSSWRDGDLERKMSGGSDGGLNNPLHINTTNVTNNNINNTLPNTSNNLQQMQYQQYPPNTEHFQYQQYHSGQETNQQGTSGTGPTVVVVPVPTREQGTVAPILSSPNGRFMVECYHPLMVGLW